MASRQRQEQGPELNWMQRVASASVGALLTSLLVTPLDVVKTRLQAQQQLEVNYTEAHSPVECKRCTHFRLHNGLMDVMLPKELLGPKHVHPSECPLYFNGTIDGLIKIYRFEGIGSLYNGLRPSLMMAVPSTVLYFASYDKLKQVCEERWGFGPMLAPLVAGSSARTLAAAVIAPLELVRTKVQAMSNPPSMYRVALNQVQRQGVGSLWQGLSPTLFRDVPFSAIYWVAVEDTRKKVRPYVISRYGQCALSQDGKGSSIEEFIISFVAGAAGGLVAATVTHPFDVVKTRRQIIEHATDAPEHLRQQETSSIAIMRRIYQQEGIAGYFVGIAPRLVKIAPACAIMLSSYEAGKKIFLQLDATTDS